MTEVRQYRFKGSGEALKYAFRDLATLERTLAITPGRIACIQAGASLGVFPKYLAGHFKTVYAFEPSLDVLPLLHVNVPETHVLKFPAALGCDRHLIRTSQTRRGSKVGLVAHEGITHVAGPGVVPTLAIDDLALPQCDLIVLDLEGYELPALRGAVLTLTRCRPTVMVEINENAAHYGYSENDVRVLLLEAGYRFVFREFSDEVFVPEERQ